MVEADIGLSDSKLAMWRGIIVMIHADEVVTHQELDFINKSLKDLNMTSDQLAVIEDDLKNPKCAHEIFQQITEDADREEFFVLARAVAWCDGNFVAQEKYILDVLERKYMTEEKVCELEKTREALNEVELCQDEWKFTSVPEKNFFAVFNFFRRRKKAVQA